MVESVVVSANVNERVIMVPMDGDEGEYWICDENCTDVVVLAVVEEVLDPHPLKINTELIQILPIISFNILHSRRTILNILNNIYLFP